jgi:1-acyl-sn-glycerol-3-phosphate acyltransferase
MMILRNLLFYSAIIPISCLFAILGWLFFFLPLEKRYWLITRWSHFFIFWAKITCGLNYRVKGLENIPKQNAIVFCNHQSVWETIFLQVLLPTQTWVLKKELLYIPFFGWGLALLDPIAIDRKHFRSVKELIKQGKAKLALGRWVVIFPEGTRVLPGVQKPFLRSGAALAHGSGYPILPITHNAGKFWPRGFLIRKSGTIDVVISPVIYPEHKAITDINKEAELAIRTAFI